MTLKVAVPASLSQAGKDYLTNKGYTLIETADQSAATLAKEATDAEEDRLDEPAAAEERRDNSQKGTHTEAGQDEAWRDDLKGEEYECGDEPQLPYWKEGDEFGHNRFGP